MTYGTCKSCKYTVNLHQCHNCMSYSRYERDESIPGISEPWLITKIIRKFMKRNYKWYIGFVIVLPIILLVYPLLFVVDCIGKFFR